MAGSAAQQLPRLHILAHMLTLSCTCTLLPDTPCSNRNIRLFTSHLVFLIHTHIGRLAHSPATSLTFIFTVHSKQNYFWSSLLLLPAIFFLPAIHTYFPIVSSQQNFLTNFLYFFDFFAWSLTISNFSSHIRILKFHILFQSPV